MSGPAESVNTEELYKQSVGWGGKMLRSSMLKSSDPQCGVLLLILRENHYAIIAMIL